MVPGATIPQRKTRDERGLRCRKCNYDLAGLQHARCPECGTPTRAGRQFSDTIAEAPVGYLHRLAVVSVVLALAALGSTVSPLVGLVSLKIWPFAVGFLFACLWAGAVFVVTMPRQSAKLSPEVAASEWRRLRWFNRMCSLAWPMTFIGLGTWMSQVLAAVAAAAAVGAPTFTIPAWATVVLAASVLFLLVGLVGNVTLSVQVADLAEWANDTGLANRLRGSAWLLMFGVVAVLMGYRVAPNFGGFVALLGVIFGSLGGLSLLAGLGIFLFSCCQMATMSLWAVSNSRVSIERDQRMAEKMDREREFALRQRPNAPAPTIDESAFFEPPKPGGRPAPASAPISVPVSALAVDQPAPRGALPHGANELVIPARGPATPYELDESHQEPIR
ncbi:MAG: hypothetical protein SFZ23_15710 [Planctomycetota bacterium]|nr:hypothetical protein [Planctomycetota bacterium]